MAAIQGQNTSSAASSPAKVQPKGVISIGLTAEQAKAQNLNSLFTKYDANHDGVIDEAEFKKYSEETYSDLRNGGIGIGGALAAAAKMVTKDTIETLSDINEEKEFSASIQSAVKATSSVNVKETKAKAIVTETDNSAQSIDTAAETINRNIDNDLDETNENSLINQLYTRYRNKEFTEDERSYYQEQGIDLDNLNDEQTKNLARQAILSKYTVDMIDPILTAIENNDADAFAKSAQILMKTQCNTADLANAIMAIAHAAGKSFSEEQVRTMVNAYAQTYQHEEGVDEELEEIVHTDVMTYADQEYIELLYKNNAQIADRLNEIAQNVANNTTDETRKAMLNNVVKNSAEIVKNSQSQTDSSEQNTVKPAPLEQKPVSNPIQNSAQVNYINDLKQAALEFQAQYEQNNVIPEDLQHSFVTVQEYRDFTGSGMTLIEYQKTKSNLKSNFTTVVDDIVKSYSTIPDKFKTKVLTLFDTLDNNMRGELFLGGSNDVRAFMNKYGYMNNEKLMTYIERHPSDLKDAPLNVQRMVEDIKKEQVS